MPATCLLSADRFLPVPRTIYFPRVPAIYDSFPSRLALHFSRSLPHNPFFQYPLSIFSYRPFFRPISSLPSDRVTSFFGRFSRTRNNTPVPGNILRVHEWTTESHGGVRLTFAQVDSAYLSTTRRRWRRPRLTPLHRPYWRPDTGSTVAHDRLNTSVLASIWEKVIVIVF